MLYRYIATYYVAQGKKEETLSSLERMLGYVERVCNRSQEKERSRNFAGYCLEYMDQDRYDPIREDVRFIALREKLDSLAR